MNEQKIMQIIQFLFDLDRKETRYKIVGSFAVYLWCLHFGIKPTFIPNDVDVVIPYGDSTNYFDEDIYDTIPSKIIGVGYMIDGIILLNPIAILAEYNDHNRDKDDTKKMDLLNEQVIPRFKLEKENLKKISCKRSRGASRYIRTVKTKLEF